MERINYCCDDCISKVTNNYVIVTSFEELKKVVDANYIIIMYFTEQCSKCCEYVRSAGLGADSYRRLRLRCYNNNNKILYFNNAYLSQHGFFEVYGGFRMNYQLVNEQVFIEGIKVGSIIEASEHCKTNFNRIFCNLKNCELKDISIMDEFPSYTNARYLAVPLSPMIKSAVKK